MSDTTITELQDRIRQLQSDLHSAQCLAEANRKTCDEALRKLALLRPTNPPPQKGEGDVWLDALEHAKHYDCSLSLRGLMSQRRELGIERYGTPLQYGNGRDVLTDLREELLDAYAYATQAKLYGVAVGVLELLCLLVP